MRGILPSTHEQSKLIQTEAQTRMRLQTVGLKDSSAWEGSINRSELRCFTKNDWSPSGVATGFRPFIDAQI
jgi:hypothetical protein